MLPAESVGIEATLRFCRSCCCCWGSCNCACPHRSACTPLSCSLLTAPRSAANLTKQQKQQLQEEAKAK